jgi:hypothetical protein
VSEGTVCVEVDGEWTQATRGSYVVIPGGFENMMPRLLQHFAENPVGDAVG